MLFVLKKGNHPEDLMQIISVSVNTILTDIIFEKYGIEEEDQMETMKQPGLILLYSCYDGS